MYGNNESILTLTPPTTCKAQLSGHLASWSSTTGLPANLWNFGVAVSGGYIYVVGGAGTGAANVATVWQITPGTDTIGTWSTHSGYNLPVALRGLNLVAYNDFLYAIGGNGGSGAVNTVYQLHLAPSGEPTPPWTAMTNLPAAVQYTPVRLPMKTSCMSTAVNRQPVQLALRGLHCANFARRQPWVAGPHTAQALPAAILPTPACGTTATSTPLVVTAAAPCGRLPTTPKLSRRGNIQLDDSQNRSLRPANQRGSFATVWAGLFVRVWRLQRPNGRHLHHLCDP